MTRTTLEWAIHRKLMQEPKCRRCGETATTGLFIYPGGEPVPDNIVPLCDACAAVPQNSLRIRGNEVVYVRAVMGRQWGDEYLMTNYGFSE